MRFALLGSPFLGPQVWAPVAERLTGLGHQATVVAPLGDSPDEVLTGILRTLGELPEDEQLVLVPHSNAGLYVAAVAAQRPVGRLVFVDALLPGPAAATPVTSPELVAELAPRADSDGRLPVWTQWWPDSELGVGADGLFPDEDTREAVLDGQRSLPLSYLNSAVPTPGGWERLPAAYLAFGENYAVERERAAAAGWPTVRLPGRHLHMLVAPEEVARRLVDLARSDAQGPADVD